MKRVASSIALLILFVTNLHAQSTPREALSQALSVFQLDKPWTSPHEQPEFVRRTRGIAAYVAAFARSHEQIAQDFAELSAHEDALVETAVRIDEERGVLYRDQLKVDVLRFLVELISEGEQTFNFSSSRFKDAYWSRAEGRGQFFDIVLPPSYTAEGNYPLFVQMYGSASMLPNEQYPFIRVRPSARGVWGFRSMSRYDIMQVIETATAKYAVDDARVYMTGTSAGATGVMHAAALRQDVFAGVVPLVAFGNDLPLANFRNLPLRCEHGVNDWTSAICNVRVQFQELDRLGYDAVLNEHPTAGHGVRTPPPKTMEWLFQQRRDPSPPEIVHTCENPRDGRAYWLTIKQFVDPHATARIEADGDGDVMRITTSNVARFSIDLDSTPLGKDQQLAVDHQSLGTLSSLIDQSEGAATSTERLQIAVKRTGSEEDKEWHVVDAAATPTCRPYAAGSAANLFQGDPLLVVYGTGADDAGNQFLRQAAGVLARSGGPDFKPAAVRFMVRADDELDDLPLADYNLLLVGTPEDNAYLKKIADRLPYKVEDGKLRAGKREPVSLDSSVLSCQYFNPEHPGRLVYVVSPYLATSELASFLRNPRHFLAGSEGFKLIDQPDLLVRGIDRKLRREMQLDADWQFLDIAGSDQSTPTAYADRVHLALAHMQVMHDASDVDLALWWGPEDKGLFGGYDFNWLPTLDPSCYTRADYLVRRRETETMTGTISGEELNDIFDRWIGRNELITWPAIAKAEIDADRDYRIVIPMDMVPKLGIRRRVLRDVAAGPNVMPGAVAEVMFAR